MVKARRGFSAGFLFLHHCSISTFPDWLKPSGPLAMCAFGEDLTCKSKEASLGIAPGFATQPCLPACLLEELLARQSMFGRNLGEKKPALGV